MSKRKTPQANLENKRKIFLEIGFIITLLVVLLVLEQKSYDQIKYDPLYQSNYQEEEDLNPIQIKKKEVIPKKPQSFMVLNTVPDDMDDDIIDIDVSSEEDEPIATWIPKEEEEEPINEIIPYVSVQEKPMYPGGEAALFRFIAQHFKVPRADLEQGVQGTIYVGFTIDKNGLVKNVYILRGISPLSDMEAIRVVSMMPPWKPGRQATRNVAVEYNLPIKVRLM